jgi:hypothetical protein
MVAPAPGGFCHERNDQYAASGFARVHCLVG